jgi:hypothetical protein
MRPILVLPSLLVILTAAACGGDSTGPSDSTISVGGTWNLQANVSNSAVQVSCILVGQVSISQSGAQFNGQASNTQGKCSGPGGTFPFTGDGPLSGGSISGNQVSYTDGICSYTGSASGRPVNLIQGNVSCNFPVQGTNIPMSGTWQLSR